MGSPEILVGSGLLIATMMIVLMFFGFKDGVVIVDDRVDPLLLAVVVGVPWRP